jgi:hypothetical protein
MPLLKRIIHASILWRYGINLNRKMMANKQTAIEWLFDKITQNQEIRWRGTRYLELFEQAKQMEKEQIKDAAKSCNYIGGATNIEAEQYYNATYKEHKDGKST